MTLSEALEQRFQHAPKPLVWILLPFLLVWFLAWLGVQMFRRADLTQLLEESEEFLPIDYEYDPSVISDGNETGETAVMRCEVQEQVEITA